jgi:conjugative relaxase-like TrwC/TraI family protein
MVGIEARSLYDMTFSPPKSVSVMTIVSGDERLVAAHGSAVNRRCKRLALFEVEIANSGTLHD